MKLYTIPMDDGFDQKGLANVLEDNRFVVHTFLLVLENFRKELYDLLILDIKMEKMNASDISKVHFFRHANASKTHQLVPKAFGEI